MAVFILTMIVLGFPFTMSEIIETFVCFDEEIGKSVCKCEFPGPLIMPEYTEAKLICTGEDSLEMAAEALTFKKNLVFSSLIVSNGTFETLNYIDLEHFPKLKNLTIRNNHIASIGVEAFKNQNFLEYLDVSFNNLTVLSNTIFEPLTNLKKLNLSYNHIHFIEPKVFNELENVLYLDLSNNQLTALDCNLFTGLKELKTLSLSNNKISYINGSFHLLHLLQLDLSFNNLKAIPSPTFFRLKNLKFLSLAMNELSTINKNAFNGNINLEKVNLTGNLWVCDRILLPLNDWLKKYEAYKEGAYCSEPPELRNYTVQHGLDYVHLEIQVEESPVCNKSMCNCSISRDKLVITVDCSNRGFEKLPPVVPYKTRVLNLVNNNIKSLTIDHIDSNLWADVSFLYLNNNVIDSLKGLEGTWLLRNLVALHLSNNRLTEIPIHILEQFRGGSLDELFLSGNPLTCDCSTVGFQIWLQDSFNTVRNYENICCSADSGIYANMPIYALKKSQLCPQEAQIINYLDVLNTLMALAIIIIIVKLVHDYCFQKRTGKLPHFFSLNLA